MFVFLSWGIISCKNGSRLSPFVPSQSTCTSKLHSFGTRTWFNSFVVFYARWLSSQLCWNRLFWRTYHETSPRIFLTRKNGWEYWILPDLVFFTWDLFPGITGYIFRGHSSGAIGSIRRGCFHGDLSPGNHGAHHCAGGYQLVWPHALQFTFLAFQRHSFWKWFVLDLRHTLKNTCKIHI